MGARWCGTKMRSVIAHHDEQGIKARQIRLHTALK